MAKKITVNLDEESRGVRVVANGVEFDLEYFNQVGLRVMNVEGDNIKLSPGSANVIYIDCDE